MHKTLLTMHLVVPVRDKFDCLFVSVDKLFYEVFLFLQNHLFVVRTKCFFVNLVTNSAVVIYPVSDLKIQNFLVQFILAQLRYRWFYQSPTGPACE
jgi:hypothetical protein